MNPYDFVPLGNASQRRCAPGHHQLGEQCGVITAKLTTIGPFVIATANRGSAASAIVPLGNGKIIPGSSIKGLLRSIAEMVGGGCISLSGSLFDPRGEYRYRHADKPAPEFLPCSDIRKLCVTCRLFGVVTRNDPWKGLVQPGEATWLGNGVPSTKTYYVTVGSPKPEHHTFYVKNQQIRGRKSYFHHPDRLLALETTPRHKAYGGKQTVEVRTLLPGQEYRFSLQYENLDQEQVSLVLYALFLQEGLAHKLGWGKATGFGTVKIEPEAVKVIDPSARYRGELKNGITLHEGADAVRYVEDQTAAFRNMEGDRMDKFRRLFSTDLGTQKPRTWGYPDFGWFKANPQKTLEEFNAEEERR